MAKFNFFVLFLFLNFFLISNSLNFPNILKNVNIEAKNGIKIPNVDVRKKNKIFQINSYFSNSPIILVLVYYKCSMLCEKILLNLSETLLKIKNKNLKYSVLVVGFDSNEKEEDIDNMLNRIKIKNKLENYNNWEFLILNDAVSSFLLTDQIGFKYKYDERSREFVHSAGIFIINNEMLLTSIIWGLEFNENDIINFLNLSKQNIFSNSKYLLLNCFHYELDKDKYGIYIIFFIKFTTLLLLFVFLFLLYKPLNKYKKK